MKDDAPIIAVDNRMPDPAVIERAASIIRSGGVVVFPTQILYGLAADALNPTAVARVYEIKRRIAGNPVSVLISRTESLRSLVTGIPDAARLLMDRLWPGGVTLVFEADPRIPENLTAGTGKIGVRLPMQPITAVLCRAVDTPITATSANISGSPGCSRIDALPEAIRREVDLILDAGPLPGGAGSTVVDVTVVPPKILREGVISAERIRAALES